MNGTGGEVGAAAAAVPPQDNPALVTVLKVLIIALFVYPLVHYSLKGSGGGGGGGGGGGLDSSVVITTADKDDQQKAAPDFAARRIVKQPACPPPDERAVLGRMCDELWRRQEQCTPEDVTNLEKHKMPVRPAVAAKNNTNDSRSTIVGVFAIGLLISSLGAALVELYKAKSGPATGAKAKPPMSRKCSLADLTVLKHNRKELVRRESILELPEDGTKPMGFSRPPLNRRSSFPVGPIEWDARNWPSRRRLSIVDGSKGSFKDYCCGSRRTSTDNDNSPERRHWSRLVHR